MKVSYVPQVKYNIIMNQPTPFPARPEELTEEFLNSYVQKFLDIADFKTIDNGKGLLDMIRQNPEHPKLKPAIRKVIGLFGCEVPSGKVCALQFLKESIEAGSLFTVECVEKSVLSQFAEVVEYRCSIKSIQRGSTYFMKNMNKNLDDNELMNLIKYSSTFFRMVHQCLYVWGAIYFPGSSFDRLRLKMEKKVAFPQYPKDFKFFSEAKVNNFSQRCSALIKRFEEKTRAAAESNSVISNQKSKSIIEEKNGSSSPRSIKKTKQAPKLQKPPSTTITPQQKITTKQKEQQKKKQRQETIEDEAIQNPPSSKRSKRHKSKKRNISKKPFIEHIKQESSEKTIQNNSSKIRKKNSFNEIPFTLMQKNNSKPETQSQRSSSQLNKRQQVKSKGQISKGEVHIKTISQSVESEGGRYSMEQSDMSAILYQNEASSPRSQYSLANKKNNNQSYLKRENSDQLPSNFNFKGLDVKKNVQVIHKQNQQNLSSKPEHAENRKEQNKQEKQKKKQYSFKLPLDQIKGKVEVAPSKQVQNQEKTGKDKKTKRGGQSTARKKFVSSEQQSIKQIKHQQKIPEKIIPPLKQFEDNSSIDYHRDTKKQIIPQMTKQMPPSSKRQESNPALPASPKKLNQTQTAQQPYQSNKDIPQQPIPTKMAKPMKLKSNSNLKSVFQSQGYQVIYHQTKKQEPAKPKHHISNDSQQKKQKTAKKSSKNVDKHPQTSFPTKQIDKRSIFQVAEIDTINTINELTPINYRPQAKDSSPHTKVPQPSQSPTKKSNLTKQSSKQSISKQQREESIPKEKDDSKHPRTKQQETSFSMQNLSNAQNNPNPPSLNRQIHNQQRQKPEIISQRRYSNAVLQKTDDYRSIKPIRNDSLYSSRRFRQFKQVNLFIQPKHTPIIPPSPPKQQLPHLSDESIKQVIKEQLLQQFNKLKSAILQKQEESLAQTINLKSEMITKNRRQNDEKIEVSTQTKLRHKSTGKFQRKNKFKLIDDSQSQQNISQINLPIQTPSVPLPTKLINIQNTLPKQVEVHSSIQKKKNKIDKEQMKPNTLLYALYKRKSFIQ